MKTFERMNFTEVSPGTVLGTSKNNANNATHRQKIFGNDVTHHFFLVSKQ